MKMVDQDVLNKQINSSIEELIRICKQECTRFFISGNQLFLLRIKEAGFPDIEVQKKVSREGLYKYIEENAHFIAWVDISIYFTNKRITIFETTIIKEKTDAGISFHCSLQRPPYATFKNKKFNVNWRSGGIVNHIRTLFS